jgi:hypothetical protein
MGRDRRVTLVDPLLADPPDHSLDRLGRDVEVGQLSPIVRRLLIRHAIDPGVGHLLLHTGTEARVIDAQRLILGEKKLAGRRGSSRRAVSRPRLPAWS